MNSIDLRCGDAIEVMKTLPDGTARCCVTSPPYFGLRDYGVDGQIGLENSTEAYVDRIVEVFREVRRVLTDDGTLWLNLGDSYGGGKQLRGTPWHVAFALQADGWTLRSDIIWHKPNPMPENARDRPTKAHEYLFLLSKKPRYYYDAGAISEPSIHAGETRTVTEKFGSARQALGIGQKPSGNGIVGSIITVKPTRNRRDVWTISTKSCKETHFAVMPDTLVKPCILAGSAVGDTVLDPFVGAGTVPMVAARHGRHAIGIDLNPDYLDIARRRIDADREIPRRSGNTIARRRLNVETTQLLFV